MANKTPLDGVFVNAQAFVRMALLFATMLLVAEVGLKIYGHAEGLPEGLTTALFGVVTTILGYAGACIQMRQQALKNHGDSDVPTLTDRTSGSTE